MMTYAMTSTALMMTYAVFAFVVLISNSKAVTSDYAQTEFETTNTSTCVTSQDEYLTLTCARGQMVRLIRAFLGHSTAGTCEYSVGDCVMDLPSSEEQDCTGSDVCRISVQSGKFIPRCQKPGTYMQALYQCIPESSSISVCNASRSVIVGQRGFLRTPGYPNNYANNLDCNFTLVAPHEDQRLMLFVIDLDLEPRGTGCSDWLQVFDGFQSITLCNRRTRYWLRNSTQRVFHIRLFSDNRTTERGFWLYYEAFPLLPSSDHPVDEDTSTSTHPTESSSSIILHPTPILSIFRPSFHRPDASSPSAVFPLPSSTWSSSPTAFNQVLYADHGDQSLTFPLLAGITATLIGCVLVTLLLIVFIKSRSGSTSFGARRASLSNTDRMDNLARQSCLKSPLGLRGTRGQSGPHEDALIAPPSPTKLFLCTPGEVSIDFCEKHNDC